MQYKWVALSNTTVGTLMASLDANIVLIALPTIYTDLHTGLFDLVWILIGYQLVTASVLVNFGRLADIFGRVRLYKFGFALFTIGSAFCSLSQTGPELIAARVFQAIGAGFLFSNSAAILTDAFPQSERGMALGINQVSIVLGSVSGLVLGGILTKEVGWQSIFYVNIPIGIFAIVWSHYKLREVAKIRAGQKIDVVGNISFAGAVLAILAGITEYVIAGLSLAYTALLLGTGTFLFVLFILTERRVKEPMLDLALFKIRAFAAGNIAILLNSLARGAVTLVLVFYLQGPTMKLDPFMAGIFLIPNSASLAFFGPISGWLSDRYGARFLASAGLIVSLVGFLLLTTIGPTITFPALAVPLILVGSGMGIFAAPNRASIMNSVPADQRGLASGISVTLVQIGATFSLAIAFLIMATVTPVAQLAQIFLGTAVASSPSSVASFISSIHLVYYASTLFLIAALVPSLSRGRQPPPAEVIISEEAQEEG
ncbi:MAG: MFS transporter [Thaumarchaeota archaeon]|nr:MFS transporter [Nitrososphaerota archaeon]